MPCTGCCLPRGTPCSQRVPGEEAAPVPPRQGVPARWRFPGPAEGCHPNFCQSEVMQQDVVGAAPSDEEKPIRVEVWDTLRQGWSDCGVRSVSADPTPPGASRAQGSAAAPGPRLFICASPCPVRQHGELEPGAGGQGSGVQQPQLSGETGKPCVSLAESREVRKWCLLLARLPGQQQDSRPVPSCGDGLLLPAEGTPLSQRWWGQTLPKVTVQCALVVGPSDGRV